MVRDEEKASVLRGKGIRIIKGDYEDYESLIRAFRGVDKLLFVSGSDVLHRSNQHKNVVRAAKESGIGHIVYTSFFRKDDSGGSPLGIVADAHIETDALIKSSGIPYTLLLNGLYLDVLPGFFGEKVTETGIFLPAGEGKASYALRSEMAETAANILKEEGHVNKEYILANTENYTFDEAAELLTEITGKKIAYLKPSSKAYKDALNGAGVPEEVINMMLGFSEAIRIGEFETTRTDLETLLGRKPSSLGDYLKSVY